MGFRPALVALLALLAACEEGVALGTQCRIGVGCTTDPTRPLSADAGVRPGETDGTLPPPPNTPVDFDAGSPSVDLDAGARPDASLLGVTDLFANGSLEVSADGGFGDFAVLDISFKQNRGVIAPWIPCQIVNFNTATSDAGLLTLDTAAHTLQSSMVVDGQTVTPAEGNTFMAMSFPPLIPPAVVVIPISQVLPQPVRRGRTYALSAKVRRVDRRHDYSLRIFLSDGNPTCSPRGPAVADEDVPDGDTWQDICLRFTPDDDYAELLLAASSISVEISPDKTVGFLLDALHESPDCRP